MSSVETKTETTTKLKLPTLYKVILLNDDFTPMEFVIDILVGLFGKSRYEALALTQEIHDTGRGVVGLYVQAVAEEKTKDVAIAAQSAGHPLKAQAVPE